MRNLLAWPVVGEVGVFAVTPVAFRSDDASDIFASWSPEVATAVGMTVGVTLRRVALNRVGRYWSEALRALHRVAEILQLAATSAGKVRLLRHRAVPRVDPCAIGKRDVFG